MRWVADKCGAPQSLTARKMYKRVWPSALAALVVYLTLFTLLFVAIDRGLPSRAAGSTILLFTAAVAILSAAGAGLAGCGVFQVSHGQHMSSKDKDYFARYCATLPGLALVGLTLFAVRTLHSMGWAHPTWEIPLGVGIPIVGVVIIWLTARAAVSEPMQRVSRRLRQKMASLREQRPNS